MLTRKTDPVCPVVPDDNLIIKWSVSYDKAGISFLGYEIIISPHARKTSYPIIFVIYNAHLDQYQIYEV